MLKKIKLFIDTVSYLKFSQIFNRLKNHFSIIKIKEIDFRGDSLLKPKNWVPFYLYDEKVDINYNTNFLNIKKELSLPDDWNNEKNLKLWTYNLHYFDDLNSESSANKIKFQLNLLELWVKDNPIGYGNGWEPYTLSLRIVNIIKSSFNGLCLNDKIINSLYTQTHFLFRKLERHLLGNHYFSNLKALYFSGIYFNESNWINFAECELIKEIDEQILSDGSNFELSPMYHAIMLSDMLDIINISNDYDSNNKNKLLDIARKKIPLMMQFLIDMHHTDSNISHFNDSANGVAPTLKKLLSYYEKLGFELNKETQFLKDYDKSGFFVLTQDETKVIFDCCEIGASYIPGHGHADTLSFELSMKEKCIFVNSGISTYEDNKIRAFQRSTKAHNTVQINSINSSEVWSSFRVGKRASILYRSSDCFKEKIFCMAAHDGYKKQGILHERSLSLCKNNLELVDKIDGKFKDAKARFYLHPDVILVDKKGTLDICVDDLKMQINLIGYEYKVLDSYYYPEFGISLPNKCLEVKYSNNLNLIKMHW